MSLACFQTSMSTDFGSIFEKKVSETVFCFRCVAVRKIFTLTFEGWPCCLATEGLVARQNLKYLHAAGA